MRGICTHMPTLDDLKEIADRGYTHIRQDLFWNMTNPKRGRYEFGAFDDIAECCERLKLEILWVLCYGNNNLYHAPDDKIPPYSYDPLWHQWLALVSARYVSAWGFEMMNEPNRAEFWKPKPNAVDYVNLLKSAAYYFDEHLIGGALANKKGSDELDWPFIEELMRLGIMKYCHSLSIHPYTRGDVKDRQDDIDRLNKLIKTPNDEPTKIIFSEMGSSLAWGLTPQEQREKNDAAFDFCYENDDIPMFEYCWHNRKAIGAVEQGYSVKPLAVGAVKI